MQETVFNVLDKVLGPFVHGLDRQSLDLSVWSGDIRLQGKRGAGRAADPLAAWSAFDDERARARARLTRLSASPIARLSALLLRSRSSDRPSSSDGAPPPPVARP